MDNQKYIADKIQKLKQEGKSHQEAVIIALSMAKNRHQLGGVQQPLYGMDYLNATINPMMSQTTPGVVPPPVENSLQGYTPTAMESTQTEQPQQREKIQPVQSNLEPQGVIEFEAGEEASKIGKDQFQKFVEEREGNVYQVQNPQQNQAFNPYAGVDIPTAAAYLGRSVERGDTLGIVGSGLKLGTGLARNFLGAMGAERRNQYVYDQYREDQRDYITQANRASYYEDGGSATIKPSYYYQDGGRKEQLPQEKLMTGEYMTGVSPTNREVQPNSEVETQEYIHASDGSSIKVEGKTHEQGGEEVELQEGDRVISDNLKLTGKNSKRLKEKFDVKVGAKDTFAKAVDKLYKKIGLQKLIDEEEKIAKRIINEEENTKDANTKNLNLQFLYKEKKKIEEKKNSLEPQRQEILDTVFKLQEESKQGEDSGSNYMQDGGKHKYQDGGRQSRFRNWLTNLGTYGYDVEYDPNKPIEEQVGAAQEWLAKNKPEVVQDYFMSQPITSKGLQTISDENPELFSKAGIEKPSNLADLSSEDRFKLQEAYKETIGEDTYNKFIIDQFQDNLFEFRAPLLPINSPSQPAQREIRGEFIDPTTPEDVPEEGVVTQEEVRRGRDVASMIPLTPDQSIIAPGGVDPSLKVNRRYDRVRPYELSPEQIITENQRQAQAAYSATANLPDSQRAAVLAQISSNTQDANARAISQVEAQNAQIRNQAQFQNSQIQQAEENAGADDALSYERRTQTAQAITEEQRQQYLDYMRNLNTSRFNDIRRMNTANQLFENYNIDAMGNISLQNAYAPDLMQMLRNAQVTPTNTTKKEK